MSSLAPQPPLRFVGLDVHKHSIMVAAVDKEQQILLRPRRFAIPEFLAWAAQHLTCSDTVVLEASTNAWPLYDALQPLVASVIVAHAGKLPQIAAARIKTAPGDALKLAKLLAANLVPAVWVPPPEVRALRTLVAHRQRLIRQRTQLRNHLHAILHTYHLATPSGDPFALRQRAWWLSQPVPRPEQLRIRQGLALLDSLEPLIGEVETELLQCSTSEPWAACVPLLVQLPGIGVLNAMLLLAAIGDITRFPTAKKLVGYSGLGVSIHSSGETQYSGGITKEGRREIRTTMVEAAWVAVVRHSYWKEAFQRLAAHCGKRKAIVAIARKLLVVVWHVLTEQVADRHAEAESVARKLLRWGSVKGIARRSGSSRATFVRQHLIRLGIGAELTTITFGREVVTLPSVVAFTGGG